MTDMTAKMVVTADNRQFINSMNRSESKMKGFGKKISGVMRRTGAEIGRFGDKIGGLTSLLGGLSVAAAGKGVIDLDTRLARLAIQAGLSKKQMFELKNELFGIGKATRQGPEQLLAGIEQIVEKTGNFEFAVKSLKSMGYVAAATGAEMRDIGASASDLQEKMEITETQVLNVFDILANQGKAGSFTLQNMAALFPRLLSSAAGFGVKGVEGMRKFGAFLQIARRGAGSSEQAATAVERTFSNIISNASKIQKLTGFSIFDPEKSKKEGRAVTKELDVVLKEIIKRTRGDVTVLQKVFGEESIRAILPLAKSFQKFGDFREFDTLAKKGGDGATIMKDFQFWSEQTAAGLRNLRTEVSKFANENLAGPIELFNKALEKLNKNPALAKGGMYGLLGLMGLGAGIRVGRGFKGLFGSVGRIFGRKGKSKGGRLSGGLLGGNGPVPVYVVNKQMSLLSDAVGGGRKGKGIMGRAGFFGKTIRGLFTRGAGGLLGAGKGLTALKTGLTVGGAGLGTTGLAVGAAGAIGAGIGTLLNKGMGLLSGKMTGGKYSGSGWLGSMIYDALHGKKNDVKNDIKINLRVDEHGRTFVETTDKNTKADAKLNTGSLYSEALGS